MLLGSGRSRSRGKGSGSRVVAGRRWRPCRGASGAKAFGLPAAELSGLIQELTTQMHTAASELHFELAARLRDEVAELKKELRQMTAATR